MMRNRSLQPLHAAVILALLALGMSPAAMARSGTISFVTGLVEIQTGSLKRQARIGMEVNEGDIILTGTNGMAQLEMIDQAKLSLRSNSTLRVQRYPENPMQAGRVLELTKGTLRAFTALLSEANRKQYTMRTRVATVGIRGSGNILNTSDDETVTLNYTIEGKHFVSANEGNFAPIETIPNQTVQVVLGQAPKIIPTPPSLLDAGKIMVGSGSGSASQTQSAGDSGNNPPPNPGGPGTGNVVGGNGLGYTLIDATA
ncbi:MAG TPA: FecR domain-containing protein, partial [Usitatibacteraceae bacterium]|nr:FecR domain-containing protein [Usitatibacteraceae bacterium]